MPLTGGALKRGVARWHRATRSLWVSVWYSGPSYSLSVSSQSLWMALQRQVLPAFVMAFFALWASSGREGFPAAWRPDRRLFGDRPGATISLQARRIELCWRATRAPRLVATQREKVRPSAGPCPLALPLAALKRKTHLRSLHRLWDDTAIRNLGILRIPRVWVRLARLALSRVEGRLAAPRIGILCVSCANFPSIRIILRP